MPHESGVMPLRLRLPGREARGSYSILRTHPREYNGYNFNYIYGSLLFGKK